VGAFEAVETPVRSACSLRSPRLRLDWPRVLRHDGRDGSFVPRPGVSRPAAEAILKRAFGAPSRQHRRWVRGREFL